jgi:SAM domain (Sterile alpha motif)
MPDVQRLLGEQAQSTERSVQLGQTNRVFWRIAGKVLFCVSSLTAVCRPTSEDVMDVTTWLRGLGLERHEATFRDNLIDMDVVRELNENDLEKLGLALG